jgi:hypothetical protein
MAWSKLKERLRTIGARTLTSPSEAVGDAMRHITPKNTIN